MKLKRTSLLFENSTKDAIKKDPQIQHSKGLKSAMHFINNALMVNFGFSESADYFAVDKSSADKFLCAGHAENRFLVEALSKSTRVSSVVIVLLLKYVKVKMYFYEKNVCIFDIDVTFDLSHGKNCGSSFGVNSLVGK
ncbi:MAG: hypothetical protein ACD_8C00089G0002 [uncultured bacterium]|nr:MAG: hypothetical protein ACD_8C00089G0002 [uncultured bacterium]